MYEILLAVTIGIKFCVDVAGSSLAERYQSFSSISCLLLQCRSESDEGRMSSDNHTAVTVNKLLQSSWMKRAVISH